MEAIRHYPVIKATPGRVNNAVTIRMGIWALFMKSLKSYCETGAGDPH